VNFRSCKDHMAGVNDQDLGPFPASKLN
jgi:hypothetical protein